MERHYSNFELNSKTFVAYFDLTSHERNCNVCADTLVPDCKGFFELGYCVGPEYLRVFFHNCVMRASQKLVGRLYTGPDKGGTQSLSGGPVSVKVAMAATAVAVVLNL